MNHQKLFFALRRATKHNELIFNKFVFDEPFSLQAILEQRANKFRNKKIASINLLASFVIRDSSWAIEGRSDLNNIRIKKKIYFTNCQFKHHVNFASAMFEDELYIADCNFDKGLKLCSSLCEAMVDIQRCTFGEHLDLSSAVLAGAFYLSSSNMQVFTAKRTTFKGIATFRGLNISRIVIISKAVFHSFTEFSDTIFSSIDSERTDLGRNLISFKQTEFKDNTDFGGVIFNFPAEFEMCRFSQNVYFGPARTDYLTGIRETVFNQAAQFKSAMFMGRSYFLVKFADNADFSDIVVTGQLFLYLNAAKRLNFKNAAVGDNFNFSPHIDENLLQDRETVQKFKHVSIQQHNTISAMRYKAREMALYKKELQQDIKNAVKQFFHLQAQEKIHSHGFLFKIGEWLLLSFNQLSNNFGLSWIRGICFTLCVWFLFFTLTIYTEGANGQELIWFTNSTRLHQSLDYFWLFNLTKGLCSEDAISIRTFIPFLIGKVFIGYGIYQTISAFRKHGKL